MFVSGNKVENQWSINGTELVQSITSY